MTAAFWTAFLFVTAAVVLACVAAVLITTGVVQVTARKPRKPAPPKGDQS